MINAAVVIQKLKSYRKQNGIRQTALAQRLHISNAKMSNWERGQGKCDPTLSQLLLIAEVLGVTLPELLASADEAAPAASPKRRSLERTRAKSVEAKTAKAAKTAKPAKAAAPSPKPKRAAKTEAPTVEPKKRGRPRKNP